LFHVEKTSIEKRRMAKNLNRFICFSSMNGIVVKS
jgi:hypothetical protein